MLRPLRGMFQPEDHPDLLVGLGSLDDAAVYRLSDEQALIATTDFFTPIVDDPYDYGAIAAANALSDVYAMGGRPLLALNIAAFPPDLPSEMLAEVMRGAAEKVREAGAVIAGGHTIQDKEPKVGLAVIGLVAPGALLSKGGARPGDRLVLTKPLGTGCIATAAKNDQADPAHVAEAVRWMAMLNRDAAEAATSAGARAATDITGFGFLGHATEMADGADLTFAVDAASVPLIDGAAVCAKQWTFPGGSVNNRKAYEGAVRFDDAIGEEQRMLLFDAQTSGGMLIALPAAAFDAFSTEMVARGAPWWLVGEVLPREAGISIIVRG